MPAAPSELQAGRNQRAGELSHGRPVERAGLIEAADQAPTTRVASSAPAPCPTAAGTTQRTGARRAVRGALALAAAAARRGAEQAGEQPGAEARRAVHQYFTQISSFAAIPVSAATPGVAAINSEVVGFAL
jgi:hypothetical protein